MGLESTGAGRVRVRLVNRENVLTICNAADATRDRPSAIAASVEREHRELSSARRALVR